MDTRQSYCHSWRRASPTPRGARMCISLPPAQRGIVCGWRITQGSTSVSPSMAIASISSATAETATLNVREEAACQASSSGCDAVCSAVLQTRLSKAHTSATSAALVVQDTPEEKLVATASLDKGMAIWRFYSGTGEGDSSDSSCEETIEVTRLKVPGAPVFSLAKIPEVLPDGTVLRKRRKPPGIYIGTASKEVLAWMLGSKDITDKIALDGHTGWVRSLAITGKWLFSCGCNCLRQWDTTFRTPKESQAVRLFTGDILAIEASDGRVFTAGADGSLRSWVIPRSGGLEEGPARERAHEGRVAACVAEGGRVYTVSYDGSIKAWSAKTLELLAEARAAHQGEKIFCAALGPNGVLFTGGDDKLIRAWDPNLNPVGEPLVGHNSAVRVLAAGRLALLVSGDAEGDVCIWETIPVNLPTATVQQGSGQSAAGPNGAAAGGLGADPAAAAAAMAMSIEEELYGPSVTSRQGVASAAVVGEGAAGGLGSSEGVGGLMGWEAAAAAAGSAAASQQSAPLSSWDTTLTSWDGTPTPAMAEMAAPQAEVPQAEMRAAPGAAAAGEGLPSAVVNGAVGSLAAEVAVLGGGAAAAAWGDASQPVADADAAAGTAVGAYGSCTQAESESLPTALNGGHHLSVSNGHSHGNHSHVDCTQQQQQQLIYDAQKDYGANGHAVEHPSPSSVNGVNSEPVVANGYHKGPAANQDGRLQYNGHANGTNGAVTATADCDPMGIEVSTSATSASVAATEALEGAVQEEEQVEAQSKQPTVMRCVDVESVASAVAVACLAKDRRAAGVLVSASSGSRSSERPSDASACNV